MRPSLLGATDFSTHLAQRRKLRGVSTALASHLRYLMKMASLSLFALLIFGTQVSATSLNERLAREADLSLFAAALERSNLSRHFDDRGEMTLFVPSDTALRNEGMAFLLETVLQTKANEQRLLYLLSNHVVPKVRLDTKKINGHVELMTLAAQPLTVMRHGASLHVGTGSVVTRRIDMDNGVIFVVDRLLWPDWQTWPEDYKGALMMTHRD